ncbi:MAG TPA: RtcB family protein [Candidatus Thermoplasmatota archaeon]|nr:RtcB family protein [Candidatus Thermoplasmatota archaeon]
MKAASPRVAAEEAPGAYKNVSDVIDTCDGAGIGRKVARLRPIGCVKG